MPTTPQHRIIEVRAFDPGDLVGIRENHKGSIPYEMILPEAADKLPANVLEALLAPSLTPGYGTSAKTMLRAIFPHDPVGQWAKTFNTVRAVTPADLRRRVDSLASIAVLILADESAQPGESSAVREDADRFAAIIEQRCGLRAFRWPDGGRSPEQPTHPPNPPALIHVSSGRCWIGPIDFQERRWQPADVDPATAAGAPPQAWDGRGVIERTDTNDAIYHDDGSIFGQIQMRFVPAVNWSADACRS